MAENFLYIPYINPVRFYETTRATTNKFQTPHFEDFMFEERLYQWDEPETWKQPWQTDDTIYLQFESTFDPITVELINLKTNAIPISLVAIMGLPNRFIPGTFSFSVSMSLAGLTTGCYRLKVTAGSGPGQKIYESPIQYISSTPLKYSFLMQYWSNRDFFEDVIFKGGLKFEYRIQGAIGRLKPGRFSERYKDQRYNPYVLSAKPFRQFRIFFGDRWGLPDDVVDLLNIIWGCSNVSIDNKLFCCVDDEFEFVDIDNKPKRGCSITCEEGLNRRSKIFSSTVDTNKKLFYAIASDIKFFGDTSNQGSSNSVPVVTVL